MKDFFSVLQKTGTHVDLDQIQMKVKEKLSCLAFQAVIYFKKLYGATSGENSSALISLQQKRYSKGDMKV